MKHILITTIAAVALVGCGESQQSVPPAEAKPVEPVAEAAQPKPPTAKAPDISIHAAARQGKIETVKQHLTDGVGVNAKGKDGRTPLYDAAYYGRKEVIELLIAKGADVNAKIEDGRTPLHRAAREGHKEVAELLVNNGADVNAKNDVGWTPLHRADYYRRHTASSEKVEFTLRVVVGEEEQLFKAKLPPKSGRTLVHTFEYK